MRKMGAVDVLFITISHNVSFMGKTWWMLMLVLRLLVLLLAGFTLFSDEQERFVCNTIQPGCSNVCFDVFAPVSVFRLWLFHLILLCLPHVMFATYVMHKVLSNHNIGTYYCDRSRGSSPFTLENSSCSREMSLNKAPLHDLPRDWATPRFHCAYLLVVILRILLETVFGAGQFFLFGFSIPKSFLCYEAPCTSGVECYISRPTEKTLMLNFMLGVASLSVLLSLVDLASSVKAMVRWRRKREMLMEEMSKGEQSSVFTTTSGAEDTDVLLTKRTVPSGSLKNDVKDEKIIASNGPNGAFPHAKLNGGTILKAGVSTDEKSPECKDAIAPRSPTPMGAPLPSHFVLHSHLNKPPLSPRPDRGPPPSPRVPTPIGGKNLGQYAPAGTGSGQQSDSSESQDKRAWV
ncbi:gap junction delta-4 protein-like [Centroberyx gerrardi]